MTTVLPAPAVDLQKLQQLEQDGLISTQKHPLLDLLIHNYTPVCQYGRAWDELTLMCRGLITDLQGNVVARPFPKFFNLSEHEGNEASDHEGFKLLPVNWQQDFTALMKYDGSLGVLYFAGDQPYLATRGSFTSDQAIRGTQILRTKGYAEILGGMDEDAKKACTLLFEIIFPANRIVVDYGDMEDLVLLDMIDNETGKSRPWREVETAAGLIGCPVAESLTATAESLRTIAATNTANEEGYVVRFADGTRVKIKFEEYVRLHRLVTGVSSKSIWENLASGQGIDELLDRVPDEFLTWVKETVAGLQQQFDSTFHRASSTLTGLHERLAGRSRKDYALEIVKHGELAPVIFALLSGKDPAPIIWKMIRPAHAKPFLTDPDA